MKEESNVVHQMNTSVMFSPYSIRGVQFKNRIVLPPMCQWLSTAKGDVCDYHIAHYGQRAIAGTGLIIVEATAVEERARISGRDLGLWSDDHVRGLTSLAKAISEFGSVPGIQLGHAGRKAWKDGPGAIAPSALAFSEKYDVPAEMSAEDIETVVRSFRAAAARAVRAGFKVLEIHAAHGYLLHQFLSPLSNKRTDEFGGTLDNRLKFPLMVTRAIRSSIPDSVVLMPRVSATEYHEKGYSLDEMAYMCAAFVNSGADMVHVSSGGSVPVAPRQWPGYQLGLAKAIKQELSRSGADIPVIGVGRLDAPELAEFALREAYCDFIAVGREMLRDPNWPSRAAIRLGEASPVVETLRQHFEPAPRF